MSANNIVGTVLIRENTLLPANFAVGTEAVFPGWHAVRNLNGYELGRQIQKANWNLFYLAGAITTIAFGRETQKTVHRAMRRIMAKLKEGKFNSLEITGLIAKRFLGIPYLSVMANSRHIQESLYLVPFENRPPVVTAAVAPSEAPLLGEVLAKQDAALVR
jgi:hypothetical protein